MVLTYALMIPALGALLVATALFGADRPAAALILSGMLLAVGAAGVWCRSRPRLGASTWAGLWGGAVVLLGQSLGPQPREAVPDLAVLIAAGAVYMTFAGMASSARYADSVIRGMGVVLIVTGGAAFLDFVTSPETVYGQAKAYHETRLTAAFLSANTAATLFGIATIFGLSGVLRVMGPGGRADMSSLFDRIGRAGTLPLLVLIFSLTCLVLTGSRGGLAATFVASASLVMWTRRGAGAGGNIWIPAVVLAGIAALLVAASGSVLGDRLSSGATEGNGRALIWAVSMEAWKEAPLFGHGFGRFEAAIAQHITADTAAVLSQQGAAHNLALQWLVQAGIVGTAGGMVMLGAALWPLRVGLKRRRRQRIVMKAKGAIALLVMLHGMVDYALEIPALVWWFSACLGLGAGVATADKTPSRTRDRRQKRREVTL
ncbi:MAG: O-antigen ligase family protein [Pseudomonadota bacterium]